MQNNEWSLEKDSIEVILNEPDDFLKIKETLTRIGVPSYKNRTLFQSCHILHKRGRYFILHFKELFMLDGKSADFSEDDRNRRNLIAQLLSDWGLVDLFDKSKVNETLPINKIKVIPFKEKYKWQLEPKYTIGSK